MKAKLQYKNNALPSPNPVVPSFRRGLLQRKYLGNGTDGFSGRCAELRGKGESENSRRKPGYASSFSPGFSETPSIVPEVLRSAGQPLDADIRAFMEPRFGYDFSKVRVHNDNTAAASALAVDALAYAVDSHIAFAKDQYAPGTVAGRHLLAHELTHVIQQERASTLTGSALRIGEPNDVQEREAERTANQLSTASIDPADDRQHGMPGHNFDFTQRVSGVADALTNVGSIALQRKITAEASGSNVNKDSTQLALYDWKAKADAFLDGTRNWAIANWTDYYGLTSSNPSLGWQQSFIYGVVSNAFGNALTSDTAKGTFNRILMRAGVGATVGGAIGNLPGAAIGFVVGVLIESIAGTIFDAICGKKESGEAATQASIRTSQLIEAKTSSLEKVDQRAKLQLRGDYIEKDTWLKNTSSQTDVDALKERVTKEGQLIKDPPKPGNRALYAAMIREWILEHAGDAEHTNRRTSESDWQNALAVAKDPAAHNKDRNRVKDSSGEGLPPLPKVLKAGEGLHDHPEIFAYQTRAHWNDVGLPLQDEAQKMIETVPNVVAENPPKIPISVFEPPSYPGDAIKAFFEAKKFTVGETPHPEMLIQLINTAPFSDCVLGDEQKQQIENRQFTLICQLDLAHFYGAVYMRSWNYVIRFKGRLPTRPWYEMVPATGMVTNPRTGIKVVGSVAPEIRFSIVPDARLFGW